MLKFKVISSNPSHEGKSFVTKINRSTVVKTFAGDKVKNETFYISGSNQLTVDTEVEVDLSMFNIVEHPFEHPTTGEIIQLKWLHLK
jgi:hypothetical protein